MIKKLITTKCELMVCPIEPLIAEAGFVYLEYVTGDNVDCIKTVQISDTANSFKYKMDDDGLYIYYRLKIPTKNHLNGDYKDKLYYDEENQTLMHGEYIIETCEQLECISRNIMVNFVKTGLGIYDVVVEPIFSICRLNHCLSELQRKFVLEGCSNGAFKCRNNSTDEFARNFLFSTVFILRQLIRQSRYEEALRILRTVENCNGLCSDTKSHSKKCNCCK